MSDKIKRQFKSRLLNSKKFDLNKISFLTLIVALIFFFGTQLYINSILSPLGSQLQSFNTEKDLLIQENREIEKDLANAQSITVVENLTNKKFKLSPTNANQLVYVNGNISASR